VLMAPSGPWTSLVGRVEVTVVACSARPRPAAVTSPSPPAAARPRVRGLWPTSTSRSLPAGTARAYGQLVDGQIGEALSAALGSTSSQAPSLVVSHGSFNEN